MREKKILSFLLMLCCSFLLMTGCQQKELVSELSTKDTVTSEENEAPAVSELQAEDSVTSEENKTPSLEENPSDLEENPSDLEESISVSKADDVDSELDTADLNIYFLDVGQASATVFENDGHYMIVDGGDRETSSYVVSFLQNLGVETLDYCIATHYDSDHISGLVGCLNVFPVKQMIAPDYQEDTKTYRSLMDKIKKQDLEVTYPKVGEEYSFGGGSFTILAPNDSVYTDPNDYSVGIRLTFGSKHFLICGDATSLSEYEMLNNGLELSSDVFVVNHHGSSSSNSEGFLEAVDPSYAVISCGLNNSYGHPTEQTMNRLESMDLELYRTDLQGTVVAECDGEEITFSVEPSMDYSAGVEIGNDDLTDEKMEENPSGKNLSENPSAAQEQILEEGNTVTETAYILNTNTKVFHLPGCSSVAQMSEKNKQEFSGTEEEAIQQGYRPCGRCLK